MTIACLKGLGLGRMPFLRDKLTSLVSEGRRMSIHCEWGMDQGSKFLKGIP